MNLVREQQALSRLQQRCWPANDGIEITLTHVLDQLVEAQRDRARGRMLAVLALAVGVALVGLVSFY